MRLSEKGHKSNKLNVVFFFWTIMGFHPAGDKPAANIQMQLFQKLSTCSP
jgi:hypothetical protein